MTGFATAPGKGEGARPAARKLAFVGAALLLELLVLLFLWAGLFALTGPCTLEYTPELQQGSPRDRICDDPGLLWAILASGLAFVPIAAALAIRRIRSVLGGLLLLVLAAALTYVPLVVFVRIIDSYSPTL